MSCEDYSVSVPQGWKTPRRWRGFFSPSENLILDTFDGEFRELVIYCRIMGIEAIVQAAFTSGSVEIPGEEKHYEWEDTISSESMNKWAKEREKDNRSNPLNAMDKMW